MLSRLLRIASLAICLMLAGSGLSSPAYAVSTVSVSVSASTIRVGYGECGRTTITASGDWTAGNNIIDISVYDPRGKWTDGDWFFDDTTGVVATTIKLCGDDDRPGRYSVVVEVSDYSSYPTTEVTASTSFRFKAKQPKRSRILTRVSRINDGPYKWLAVGKLMRNGHGYADRPVWIQALIDYDWYDIEKNRTNRRGLFGWEFKPNRFVFRYAFKGDVKTKPSVSKAFRVRGGRVVAARSDAKLGIRMMMRTAGAA